jgi:hypothetical protein
MWRKEVIIMNCYARFKEEIVSNSMNITFKKNDNSKNTRYAVISEDEIFYFIANKPNDINCNEVTQVGKGLENEMFTLVEE